MRYQLKRRDHCDGWFLPTSPYVFRDNWFWKDVSQLLADLRWELT